MEIRELTVKTSGRSQLVDITEGISQAIASSGIREGACVVFVPHTTAGITINEAFDQGVSEDLLRHLERMVPSDLTFAHAEGNSDAHIKTALVGSSVMVPVVEGRLALGRWQGIMLCEFDGPRSRKVLVRMMGECRRS